MHIVGVKVGKETPSETDMQESKFSLPENETTTPFVTVAAEEPDKKARETLVWTIIVGFFVFLFTYMLLLNCKTDQPEDFDKFLNAVLPVLASMVTAITTYYFTKK